MIKILKNDWIAPFLKKYRLGLVIAIFLGLLTFLCAGLLMFSAGYVISKSATKPLNILIIYVPVLMVRVFGISRPLVRYIERLTSHNWILKLTSDLRRKLYIRLESRAIQLSQEYKLGDLLGILNQDIANLQDLYLRTLFPLLIAGSLSIALVIAAGVFSLGFAFGLAIIFVILYAVVPLISVKMTVKSDEKLKRYRNELFTDLTDNVLGLQDWVLSGRKEDFLQNYRQAESSVRKEQKQLFDFARWRNLGLQIIFGLLVIYLIVWSGSYLHGGDMPNYIAAVVLLVFPLFDAYSPLSDALVETNRYADSAERLSQLPEEAPSQLTEETVGSDIDIQALNFSFDNHEVFSNFNLSIPKGEKIAILGRSGVGKSTLASLIRGDLTAGLGSVQVGGVESSRALHIEKTIGVINQSPYLFATTLRNNLTLGKLDATDEEVWRALEIVGLKPMVQQLPLQLQEHVDESGQRFSGGERQRLALARILLSDTEIVILDEPTVSLDPITENQLLTLFFEALQDKTIILITHHLLGIHNVNRVIFLEKGKITIDGSPDDLLEKNEKFKALYKLDKGA